MHALHGDDFELGLALELLELLEDVLVRSVDRLRLVRPGFYQNGVVLEGKKNNVRVRETEATRKLGKPLQLETGFCFLGVVEPQMVALVGDQELFELPGEAAAGNLEALDLGFGHPDPGLVHLHEVLPFG